MDDDEGYGREREREAHINGDVKSFIHNLNKRLRQRAVYDIRIAYEEEFNKLTERYYKGSTWPSADSVAALVDNDDNFLVLYKELYFRHIYAKLAPSVDDRFESFQNYLDLFNIILGLTTDSPELELPSQWLWDMVDEFIYQFRSFHQFRTKRNALEGEEMQLLRDHPHAWSAQTVILYLQYLVRKAGTLDIDLKGAGAERKEERDADKPQVAEMFLTLGEYSLIGLVRVMTLLGDYTTALEVLEPLPLTHSVKAQSNFPRVLAAQVTLYYYMGFAYLMTRRYADAVDALHAMLLHIERNRHSIPQSYQHDNITKKVSQMCGLLAIASQLGFEPKDEALLQTLRDKWSKEGGNLNKIARWDLNAFEGVFAQSCPKFITPCAPDYERDGDTHMSAYMLQLKIFRMEIQQRKNVPELHSYLKMCTSISTSKLATLQNVWEEDALPSVLMKAKHKARGLRSPLMAGGGALDGDGEQKGGPAEGEFQVNSAVDFFINKDMVHVVETSSVRKYGKKFISEIFKTMDLQDDIRDKGALI